ncbi:MAG TPA: ornithine cyclodeaminase family protein [Pyrinomonadaceae bacterium]|nr:ornithine cyclodeaminase family protein [Pyrinomonadaceae bacterium]
MTESTLLLTRSDVAALLTIDDYIASIERVFKLYGEGKTGAPGVLGVHAPNGGFHIKAGMLDLDQSFFAAKINANFPQNATRFGLPLIQGVIVLCNAENGLPLAVMDSIEITIQRTGAATAVAAKYLARKESKSLTVCGCGNQGRISVQAISKVFPIDTVFAFDIDSNRAAEFAEEVSHDFQVIVTDDVNGAVSKSDLIVTCTPSNKYFLGRESVRAGTFIAAVGADNESKQELDPSLLAENTTIVDVLDQSAAIGELHHALEAGLMARSDVRAELGEVVAGIKPGRTSADEIIVFDSTGMALQDVIAAVMVYERAKQLKVGKLVDLTS